MTAPGDTSGRRRGRVPLVPLYVTVVVGLAIAATVVSAISTPLTARDLGAFVVLTVLAVGYDWVARRVESVRRRTNSGPYVTMDSVWVIAAALNLPVTLIAGVLVATQLHAEYQGRRTDTSKPWVRIVFNIGASLLPAVAVAELVHRSGALADPPVALADPVTPLVLIGAVVLYALLNTALVGVVIALSTGERSLLSLAGTVGENLVELATLALGVLVGVALTLDVWLSLLAIPILVLLQRIALVDHLESAASEDSKTGLLNSAAWHHMVERELERSRARGMPATVMVLDLDHFKRVNDTYGHLTGDVVLRAVAECMRAMLRDRDQVARFGGEEFVAFLPGADHSEAVKVAERLRRRIADTSVDPVGRAVGEVTDAAAALAVAPGAGAGTRALVRVTASIGVATFPGHGDTLDDLLAQADTALYAAKNGGRNQIRSAA